METNSRGESSRREGAEETTVWICSYLPARTGAGVERFVTLLSNAILASGRRVRVVDVEEASIKSGILRNTRYYVAWRIGRIVNRKASPGDIIICSNFFSWNAKRERSLVVYHGTEAGRVRETKGDMGVLRYLAVSTVGVFLDRRVGKGRLSVAVAAATKEEIERYYRQKVTAVIPNAVDLSLFRPASPEEKARLRARLGLPRDKLLVLFVGTKDPRKGLNWILERIAPNMRPTQHLVVRANMDRVPEGVTLVGRLPLEDLANLYRSCDVFLFPTKYEGCSFTLLEALAAGLPVVTSPAGSGTDLLADERLKPYIIEGFDAKKYLECLERLEKSPQERRTVSTAARDFAEKNYDLSTFEKAYLDLIEHIEAKGSLIPPAWIRESH